MTTTSVTFADVQALRSAYRLADEVAQQAIGATDEAVYQAAAEAAYDAFLAASEAVHQAAYNAASWAATTSRRTTAPA